MRNFWGGGLPKKKKKPLKKSSGGGATKLFYLFFGPYYVYITPSNMINREARSGPSKIMGVQEKKEKIEKKKGGEV